MTLMKHKYENELINENLNTDKNHQDKSMLNPKENKGKNESLNVKEIFEKAKKADKKNEEFKAESKSSKMKLKAKNDYECLIF